MKNPLVRCRQASLVPAVLLLAACQSVQTTQPGVVGVDRKQSMSTMVSAQAIEQTAARAYEAEVAQARAHGLLNADAAQTVRVRRIAARLIGQTAVFRTDAKDWKWTINVESNRALNAFCMPGGRIMVYTGLIDGLMLTDDELATVMAHEIAHALREHSREQVSRAYAQQFGLGAVAALAGLNDASLQLASVFSDVTFTLPKSRLAETEADQIGLELMARAGYEPKAALSLWEKMAKAGQGATPGFFSTHPSGTTRMAEIRALLPKVEPLYEQAKKP